MLFTVMSTARIALESYFKGYYNFIVQKEMISLNKNTLGVKKCEANQKQCTYTRPKGLISSKAKKVSISLLEYFNLIISYTIV